MIVLMDAIEQLNRDKLPFAKLLGIRFVAATPECVTAEMLVREDMCTRPAILHGGAMMALADTLGGCATSLNLRVRCNDHHDRIEDQLHRAGDGWYDGAGGVRRDTSGAAHDGLADAGDVGKRQIARSGHANADGAAKVNSNISNGMEGQR